MMKLSLFTTLFSLIALTLFAQDAGKKSQFKAEFSKSEILLGNTVRATFTIENVENPQFEAPDWSPYGLKMAGGSSQSSSYQIINGEATSTVTYTFSFRPTKEGTIEIPALSLETPEGKINSNPLIINVLPNPNGITEQEEVPETETFFWGRRSPEQPKKKKRNTVKL